MAANVKNSKTLKSPDLLISLGLEALADVASDENAPSAARVSAANALLVYLHKADPKATPTSATGAAEMDLDAINRELLALS
tara:strand:+ start:87 stop:332 length:246 start_codon:yes stop_codon:yes gene_type:complete